MRKKNNCKIKNCKHYKTCNQKKDPFKDNILCRGYLHYVQQDIIREKGTQFEIPISHVIESILVDDEERKMMYDTNKSKKELIIQMYFFDGDTNVKNISEKLYCSEQYVYSEIRKCKMMLLKSAKKLNKPKKSSIKNKS
jgi:hypothetical protein